MLFISNLARKERKLLKELQQKKKYQVSTRRWFLLVALALTRTHHTHNILNRFMLLPITPLSTRRRVFHGKHEWISRIILMFPMKASVVRSSSILSCPASKLIGLTFRLASEALSRVLMTSTRPRRSSMGSDDELKLLLEAIKLLCHRTNNSKLHFVLVFNRFCAASVSFRPLLLNCAFFLYRWKISIPWTELWAAEREEMNRKSMDILHILWMEN